MPENMHTEIRREEEQNAIWKIAHPCPLKNTIKKKKNYYKIKDIHNAGWFYVTKETNFLRNLLSFECKGNLTRIYFKMFEFPQKA